MKRLFWAFFAIFLMSVEAKAATINVTTIVDENDGCNVGTGCSLREAISSANSSFEADTIKIPGTNGTYFISFGTINIDSEITIRSSGDTKAIIDGSTNASSSLFRLTGSDVKTFENLKIQNFDSTANFGSVIFTPYYSPTTINLTNCSIINNSRNSVYGPIFIAGSDSRRDAYVNITGLEYSNNGSNLGVGAIYSLNATVNITQSVFSSNNSTSGAMGGGLYLLNVALDMQESIFSENQSSFGGGAYLGSVSGTLNHVLFTDNTAENIGGGLNIASDIPTIPSSLIVKNSAFFNNTAKNGSAVSALNYMANGSTSNIDFISTSFENNRAIVTDSVMGGGAVYITKAHVTFNFSTIAKNTTQTTFESGPLSAGLVMYNEQGTIITKNSIIADNDYIAQDASQTSANCANLFQPSRRNPPALLVTSYGGNILDSDCTPAFEDGEADQFDVALNFGDIITVPEFGYNITYNLLATSPAIDNSLDCTTAPLATQSGSSIPVTNDINLTSRPYGLACDTGAVELTCTLNSFYADADGDGFGTGTAVQTCKASMPGYAANNTDCDDTNAALLTVASIETCDGVDNNCNGESDEGVDCTTPADPAIPADPETPGTEVTPGDETTIDDPVTGTTPTTDTPEDTTANKSSGSGGCSLTGDSSTTNHVASGLMLSLMILGLMKSNRILTPLPKPQQSGVTH